MDGALKRRAVVVLIMLVMAVAITLVFIARQEWIELRVGRVVLGLGVAVLGALSIYSSHLRGKRTWWAWFWGGLLIAGGAWLSVQALLER